MKQLLFPFCIEFVLAQYVTNEKTHILNKHKEYLIKTQTPIHLEDFLGEHYCNSESPYFEAANYEKQNNPLLQRDGEVVLWENYLK